MNMGVSAGSSKVFNLCSNVSSVTGMMNPMGICITLVRFRDGLKVRRGSSSAWARGCAECYVHGGLAGARPEHGHSRWALLCISRSLSPRGANRCVRTAGQSCSSYSWTGPCSSRATGITRHTSLATSQFRCSLFMTCVFFPCVGVDVNVCCCMLYLSYKIQYKMSSCRRVYLALSCSSRVHSHRI